MADNEKFIFEVGANESIQKQLRIVFECGRNFKNSVLVRADRAHSAEIRNKLNQGDWPVGHAVVTGATNEYMQ